MRIADQVDAETIDALAPMFLYLESIAFWPDDPDSREFKTLEEAKEQWERLLATLDNDVNWKGGKHFGDCTNFPMTCQRCEVEGIREDVRALLQWLTEGGHRANG